MLETAALRVAVNLLHMPSALRRVREEPLPAGVHVLLCVVAGENQIEREAAAQIDRPLHVVREAAAFFIEQVLLSPDAESYRVLGADPAAAASELRRNMALLLRWLHPDLAHSEQRKALVERVTLAWGNLKTPERRADYDARRGERDKKPRSGKRRRATSKAHNGVRVRHGVKPNRFASHAMLSSDLGADTLLRRALRLFFGR